MPTTNRSSSCRQHDQSCQRHWVLNSKAAAATFLLVVISAGCAGPWVTGSQLDDSSLCSEPGAAKVHAHCAPGLELDDAQQDAGPAANASVGASAQAMEDSRSSQAEYYARHASLMQAMAAVTLPRKSSSDRGGYIEFLLFVSEVVKLPSFNDKQFGPVVIPILPPNPDQEQQDAWQLGMAANMNALLAQHKAQFIVTVGDSSHFKFLQQQPAQVRQITFHIDEPQQLTVKAVETFFWAALQAPPGGSRTEPLLSLFTPAYKTGSKIHIPYQSLLAQTYQNWQWVIYDDSPPGFDETWKELSALRDMDYRIRLYKSDRNDAYIGSVKAKACNMATGQLLIELDHDDLLTPDALELLKDALVANPDAGFFFSEAIEQYEGTNKSVQYPHGFGFGQGGHYKMLINDTWFTSSIAPIMNQQSLRHIVGVPNHVRAWRREAYHAVGGHMRGLPVADDYDLILRTVAAFPSVYVRHMMYIQYRQEDGSTFTFTRNALIQRMVKLLSIHHDAMIHKTLMDHGHEDEGRGILDRFTIHYLNWKSFGPPIPRYYYKPVVDSPADKPFFTVVIATWNNTKGLHRAIQSVYEQDYDDWELVITGDKCPLLDGYMEQHKAMFRDGNRTVRYFNLPVFGGGGLYSPRNAAVKGLAATDWIAYIDDDAVWRHDHLSSLAAKIAEDPERMYVFSSLQMKHQVLLANQPRKYRLDTSSVAHHRHLTEKYGGWRSRVDVGVANDWELFSRWADEPWGATLLPTAIYPDTEQSIINYLVNVE